MTTRAPCVRGMISAMAAKKWDLTRPPFIDERVWSIAIKRRKSGWTMGYYLQLMTIEPTEADITLRAVNSRLNKDYGEFPTGLVEAKSVLDVIQQRSDNLGIPYNQAKADVYGAIAWVVCDMQGTYGCPMRNVTDPFERILDLYPLYPQMAWFFLTELFLKLIAKINEEAHRKSQVVLHGVQSAILRHLEDKRFGVRVFMSYRSVIGQLIINSEDTIGCSSWMRTHGFFSEEQRESAERSLSRYVEPTLFGDWNYEQSFLLRSLSGGFLLSYSNLNLINGFNNIAMKVLNPSPIPVPVGEQYEFVRREVMPFYAESFRDFIRRWPPSQPSGELEASEMGSSAWAVAGAVAGAAAVGLYRWSSSR